MSLRNLIVALPLVFMCAATIIKWRVIFSDDRAAKLSWVAMLFLTAYPIIGQSPILESVDNLTGIHNISFFISYVSTTIGLYCVASVGSINAKVPMPRWKRYSLIPALLLLEAIFFSEMTKSQWYPRVSPRSIHDLAFMNIAYFYDLILSSTSLGAFLYLGKKQSPARSRWLILSIVMTMAVFYHLIRATTSIIGYFAPTEANALRPYLTLTRSTAFITWTLTFLLPKKAHLALSNIINSHENRVRVKYLRQIREELDCHLALAKGKPSDISTSILGTADDDDSAQVQQTLIDIEDRKLMLAFHLKRGYQSEAARQILLALDKATANGTETDGLIAAYAKIGKGLQTR